MGKHPARVPGVYQLAQQIRRVHQVSALTAAAGQNAAMAKTTAERQAEFKQAMKDAGYVRLEAYVTREQREKFRQLGGDDWLRKKIEGAKPKEPKP